jgi:hypothetical protein
MTRFIHWIRNEPVVSGIGLGVAGVLIIVVGVWGLVVSSSARAEVTALGEGSGVVESGTFVGTTENMVKAYRSRPARTYYCPRYEYTGPDGVPRTIVDHDSCESDERQLSEKPVRVLIDPDHPATAFIDEENATVGRSSHTIFSGALLVFGIGLVVAAPVNVVHRRHRRTGR